MEFYLREQSVFSSVYECIFRHIHLKSFTTMTFSGTLEEMKIKLQGQDILKTYMRERLDREQYKCRLTQQTESLKFHQSIQTTRSNRIIYELLRFILISLLCQSKDS